MTLAITASGMLSLSNSFILSISFGSLSSSPLAAPHQSSTLPLPSGAATLYGFTSNMMHVACAVSSTPTLGVFMPRTSPTSALVNLLRASTAASYAGIAAARSFSQSALISAAFCFWMLALPSSSSTRAFFSMAAACSDSTRSRMAPVSWAAFSNTGSISLSSTCSEATCSFASLIFSRPVSYRHFAFCTSCRWLFSVPMKELMSSK
mmetsp:Transcript_59660/g.172796  ORF Transcript_59660/g.172796 Transcript_59660/m.172796 type:complete len:207 (+) Transcript_59660:668-1288(+)